MANFDEGSDSLEFENLLNFRDVASSTSARTKRTPLRPGLLYRSARPDNATHADKHKLLKQLGIKTIVDLRSKTEHIEAAQKHASRLEKSELVPQTNAQIAQALKIPGIDYAEINLNGKGFERHLVWQLRYKDLACLAGYMAFGYRLQGISIIGKNVLLPRGLIGLGKDTIAHSGPEIKEVFDLMANPSSYPVLVHCTQGKDRTGLIVMLVLLLCGVEIDDIVRDYVLSEEKLKPEFEERMKEIRSIGLDESFAACPPEFVPEVNSFINSQYGGVENYLLSIGVDRSQIDAITTQLMVSG